MIYLRKTFFKSKILIINNLIELSTFFLTQTIKPITMKKILFFVFALAFLAACQKEEVQVAPAAKDGAVVTRTDNGGNQDCPEGYEFSSGRLDEGAQCSGSVGPISWTSSADCKSVSWTWNGPGTPCGIAIVVKGGDGSLVYTYGAGVTSGTGLMAPLKNGRYPAISNITFCWNVCPPEDCQWCSPGYWRNHLGAWPAGYADLLYNDFFSPGFADNPTLLQVVSNPQVYGGPATNDVADILSDAHPDIEYCGTQRDAESHDCPLN
jgi:hypothetical protein